MKDELINATSTLATPLTREQLLQRIIEGVPSVNFRQQAGGDSEIKISVKIYKVIVIRELLRIAKALGYPLGQKHDACYIYNGAYWVDLDFDYMKTLLGEVAEKMGVPLITAHDVEFREQLYKQFQSAACLYTTEIHHDTILINLKNGTFEFTADGHQLREFRERDFLTYQLPFAYDPESKAPMFEAYLDRVLPDKQSQQQLKEYSGYIFTRGLKLEKVLLLSGMGSNGKSVFFDILTGLLGPQNCCSFSLRKLADSSNEYSRAMIGNKLVNYTSEISNKFDSGILKQLVSGEPIEARHPYGRPFMLTNYAKLIFNVNELPYSVEHTAGFFRRFLIIPFMVTIPEEERDVMLAKKIIENELPGVFNWILEGLTQIVTQKRFSDSEASTAALKEYETESNTVALFIKEMRYEASMEKVVTLSSLYKEFQEFCKSDGYRALSKKVFIRRLRHLKIYLTRRGPGNVVFLEKVPL